MPELRRLRYAVAVADELNFTRAAEKLGVSQQVLSEQVRRLEDELGLRIFDRTTRHVRVTSHGRPIVDEARAVVAAADALRDRARRLGAAQTGVVLLGYWRTVAFDTAPRLVCSRHRVAARAARGGTRGPHPAARAGGTRR